MCSIEEKNAVSNTIKKWQENVKRVHGHANLLNTDARMLRAVLDQSDTNIDESCPKTAIPEFTRRWLLSVATRSIVVRIRCANEFGKDSEGGN
jgi:hypothetical protein